MGGTEACATRTFCSKHSQVAHHQVHCQLYRLQLAVALPPLPPPTAVPQLKQCSPQRSFLSSLAALATACHFPAWPQQTCIAPKRTIPDLPSAVLPCELAAYATGSAIRSCCTYRGADRNAGKQNGAAQRAEDRTEIRCLGRRDAGCYAATASKTAAAAAAAASPAQVVGCTLHEGVAQVGADAEGHQRKVGAAQELLQNMRGAGQAGRAEELRLCSWESLAVDRAAAGTAAGTTGLTSNP